MSFEDMISQLDGASGRLITLAIINPVAREAMEMIQKVSISLGEVAQNFEETPKWIPCSERLPECDYGYENTEGLLFQLKSGSIEAGFYGTGGNQRDKYFRVYRDDGEGFDARDVVAWMPLPKVYEPN